jgi:hypothetical protein
MLTPQEAYSAAILRACEAHLVRVKAARATRNLAVSMVAVFGELDPRPCRARSAVHAKAERHMKKRQPTRKRNARRMKQSAWTLARCDSVANAILEDGRFAPLAGPSFSRGPRAAQQDALIRRYIGRG